MALCGNSPLLFTRINLLLSAVQLILICMGKWLASPEIRSIKTQCPSSFQNTVVAMICTVIVCKGETMGLLTYAKKVISLPIPR